MKTFLNYIKESFAESKHIKWPTRNETIWFTVAVIIISLVVAYYLHAFDLIFAKLLDLFIKNHG